MQRFERGDKTDLYEENDDEYEYVMTEAPGQLWHKRRRSC